MNLDEILHNHLNPYFKGGAIEKQAKEAMREAVKQALELAAERAEILDKETGISWTGILIADEASYEVDKKSIMNVMDEIE